MTGSTETGQEVFRAAADDLKAVRLELGGKAPFIVMEDADLDLAAQVATDSRFINAGQVCTCNERMYVHERVYSKFMEKFLDRVKKVRVGDPMTNVDFGPKVSAEELQKVDSMVQQAIKDGCELALGGKRPSGSSFDKGHWYEPTVLLNAKNNMRIMQEEIFGPVAPVMEVGSFDEALSLANDSRYGLSAFVFTNDVRRVMRLVNELDFGEIYVNRPMGEQRQGFHNGWKMSGTGGEDGKYGIENYLQKKSMYVDYSGGGDG
jgi:lactaldehyde dehydrogenase/glycolaldehyde dehydrogenase